MAALKKAGIAGGICSVMTIIGIVVSMGHIRTNKAGLEIMGNAESCRRAPYYCPAGDLTDGVGNIHGVYIGSVKTDKQITDGWTKNIHIAEKGIDGNPSGIPGFSMGLFAKGTVFPIEVFTALINADGAAIAGCAISPQSFFYAIVGHNFPIPLRQHPSFKGCWLGC